jgi:adenylylsulfate kinase
MSNKNIKFQDFKITVHHRSLIKNQKPKCLWFTGLPSSGKTTLANKIEERLFKIDKHSYILDGDNLRHGICSDLNFSEQDRVENIRRAAEISKLMFDAGLIVIVSLVSPYKASRDFARGLFNKEDFYEIYLNTSLDICEKRDVKGLYQKARSGQIKDFTGIGSDYEPPQAPNIEINTNDLSINDSVDLIFNKIFNED